jgi:hypothetical protein
VPVGAATWSSLMDAVATTPAARRLSTSTSGKPPCSLSNRLRQLAAASLTETASPGQHLDAMQTFCTTLCPAGAKSSILSVIPPDTPDDGPAAGNARRQSTASSMMT